MKNDGRILVCKPDRKTVHGRDRSYWDDIMRTDLKEVGCENVNWINLAKDRIQGFLSL
jgi:hypothetical protein